MFITLVVKNHLQLYLIISCLKKFFPVINPRSFEMKWNNKINNILYVRKSSVLISYHDNMIGRNVLFFSKSKTNAFFSIVSIYLYASAKSLHFFILSTSPVGSVFSQAVLMLSEQFLRVSIATELCRNVIRMYKSVQIYHVHLPVRMTLGPLCSYKFEQANWDTLSCNNHHIG